MKHSAIAALSLSALCGLPAFAAPAQAAGPYHVQAVWKVGGEGGWDYLAVDPHSKLLYITRGDHVMVIDTASGKQVADIPGLHGIHCVVFSSDGIHGYITDGGANQVVVFNRRTNTVEKTIPAGDHPDGAVFEPVTKTVWAFNGRSHNVTVIDTKDDRVAATIALPGKPEFPVADGRGFVFDNIEDKSELVKLNAKTLKLDAAWPLAPCESPSGSAIDTQHHRVFSVCDNQKMAVADADNGRVVATVDIGDGPDAARFTPHGDYAFSPNGDAGTLTVVHEDSPDRYSVVQTLTTKRGARTMAMDPDGARVYVVTADFGPRPEAASADNPHRRPPMVPDSFEIIAIGK